MPGKLQRAVKRGRRPRVPFSEADERGSGVTARRKSGKKKSGKKSRKKGVPRPKRGESRASARAKSASVTGRALVSERPSAGRISWAEATGRSQATAVRAVREAALAAPSATDGAGRYLELAGTTISGLSDALALLRARDVLATGDERRLITVELADIKAERAKVRAEMLAFLANEITVRPPTDAEVAQAKALATDLENLAAESTRAEAVVDLATRLFELWQKTRT
jgi:hypothetical protein